MLSNIKQTVQDTVGMATQDIPKTYKAAVIKEKGKGFVIEERNTPTDLKPNQVLMRVEANGICGSDAFTYYAAFPGVSLPRVPGHEVVGKIVKRGSGVPEKYTIGGRYGRGWFGGACFHCENCRKGDYVTCDSHQVSGITDDGGYAEYIVAPWESLAKIPDSLSSVEAAPLMCAGVTVFNGLRSAGARPPQTVAVIGLGGLGHLALQFANKMGYRVVAVSSSDDKKDFAMKLGAHEFVNSKTNDIGEGLKKLGGANVILSTMDNVELMSKAVGGLATNGRLIIIGASTDAVKVVPASIIGPQLGIIGHASGTSKDSEDTLLFASLFGVKAITEEYSLADAQKGFDAIQNGKAKYRGVIVPTK